MRPVPSHDVGEGPALGHGLAKRSPAGGSRSHPPFQFTFTDPRRQLFALLHRQAVQDHGLRFTRSNRELLSETAPNLKRAATAPPVGICRRWVGTAHRSSSNPQNQEKDSGNDSR